MAWTPLGPSSLVNTGQPEISVQPPSPFSISTPFLPDSASRVPGSTAQDIVGGGVTLDQADRSAIGFCLFEIFAEPESHQVIVGAEIGLAQRRIFLLEVGVQRHDRYFRLGGLDGVGDQGRVGRRDRHRDGVGFAEHVSHDLGFTGLVRRRRRSGIEAVIGRTGVLLIPFLATLVDRFEERGYRGL